MSTVEPSREELLALLAQAHARIAELEAELAALRARLGKDSTNSSRPPSQDPPAAKAKRKVARSQRVRSKTRKRGGQPGHPGAGLAPASEPDRTERLDPQGRCECGADLAQAAVLEPTWAQVWDIPPVALEKVHYELGRRRCGCGRLVSAAAPFGRAGTVMYGPNVNIAAVTLGSEGNLAVEATASMMGALLGAPVSAGFVALARRRFSDRVRAAGFDEALAAALRAEPVLGADETPVNVVSNVESDGTAATGSPHVVVVRTPDERLVCFRPITSRTKDAIRELGLLDGWGGVLVRDDYAGWHQFDAQLAGVQQCGAHLLRHLAGVGDLDEENKVWACQAAAALRDGAALATKARTDGKPIDPKALAEARERYDQALAVGISLNLSRPWHKGNHPGLVLARRLKNKAHQVWLFTENLLVPFTNNASEQALRGPKRHQKTSGCWQSTRTLERYCRERSYLVSARNHGLRVIDAIRAALYGICWLPKPAPT